MKEEHDAKWFYQFFAGKNNWCSGALTDWLGNYCAVGHLNKYAGMDDRKMHYGLAIVRQCSNILGKEVFMINDTVDADKQYMDPKQCVLKALRKAIKEKDPDCQLGKEYDDV